MAGTVPIITPRSLVIERGLQTKPIYFVKVNGQSLVIKGEAPGGMAQISPEDKAISIKWTSKLMKNVNNKLVNTKIMTPAEVNLFKPAALLKFIVGSAERKFVEPGAPDYKWVKMPVVGGLSDADFFGEGRFAKAVSSKVKKVIVKFTDETLWPPLGKIVAVDIFNGNNDRFTSDGDWQNFGNVMFLEGGDTSVIGLDTFDPNSALGNMAVASIQGSLDPLLILTDPVRRKTFAEACTESVGRTLARQGLGVGAEAVTIPLETPESKVMWKITKAELNTLYVQYAPLFAAGILKGADELKLYLQNKVRAYRVKFARPLPPLPQPPQQRQRGGLPLVARQGLPQLPDKPRNIPQGVWDRMVFLGWQV